MKKILIFPSFIMAFGLASCGDNPESDTNVSNEIVTENNGSGTRKSSETISKTDAGGYVMGDPDAPMKLVAYLSLTCSHCKDFSEEAFDLIRDNYVESGRVSFEVRNFVRDPLDLSMAILTQCGGDESYFSLTSQALKYQNELFDKAIAMGETKYREILNSDSDIKFVLLAQNLGLFEYFQQNGLSNEQAKTCLSDETKAEVLMSQTEAAGAASYVDGTPTFFINGRKIQGTNWASVESNLTGNESPSNSSKTPSNPSSELMETSDADCASMARGLAISMCVNRAFNLLNPHENFLRSAASEAAKLPASCEPFHGNTVGDGMSVGNEVFNRIIDNRQSDPSEQEVASLCATMVR